MIRIANCSGFYGDRLSAAKEMVEGGPIDALTGDWLAELTMLILARTQAKRPGSGFARTFVTQMEQVMGTCLDRGIKVVSNAGGLDPDHCAEAVADVADTLGLTPTIAYVNGDDLLPRLDELRAAGVDIIDHETGDPVAHRPAPAAQILVDEPVRRPHGAHQQSHYRPAAEVGAAHRPGECERAVVGRDSGKSGRNRLQRLIPGDLPPVPGPPRSDPLQRVQQAIVSVGPVHQSAGALGAKGAA